MTINPYESPREVGYNPTPRHKLVDWMGLVTCLVLAFGFWAIVFALAWALGTRN